MKDILETLRELDVDIHPYEPWYNEKEEKRARGEFEEANGFRAKDRKRAELGKIRDQRENFSSYIAIVAGHELLIKIDKKPFRMLPQPCLRNFVAIKEYYNTHIRGDSPQQEMRSASFSYFEHFYEEGEEDLGEGENDQLESLKVGDKMYDSHQQKVIISGKENDVEIKDKLREMYKILQAKMDENHMPSKVMLALLIRLDVFKDIGIESDVANLDIE